MLYFFPLSIITSKDTTIDCFSVSIIQKIILAFSPPVSPPAGKETRQRLFKRKIVSRLSIGSILMQKGRYITAANIKERKAKLSGYVF